MWLNDYRSLLTKPYSISRNDLVKFLSQDEAVKKVYESEMDPAKDNLENLKLKQTAIGKALFQIHSGMLLHYPELFPDDSDFIVTYRRFCNNSLQDLVSEELLKLFSE